ncbi:hypothetical protein A9Q99_13190 [Gammaproteobacteria bacterium 45_16_T64]|nr:hypothetical protein A9Q99_13190 [Gammaproteobacteria bacterium 45_16_T64]
MAVKKERKPQGQRKEESENKLFNALINILNSDGINAATCERIGAEAGVSRGLANQRLGKRDEMFARLVDKLKQAQIQQLANDNVEGLSGHAALRRYIDIHFEDIQNNPAYQAYFVLVAGSIAISPLLNECVEDTHLFVRDMLERWIRRGIEQEEFVDSIDPVVYAATIGSYLLGVAIQAGLTGTENIELLKPGAYTLVDAIKTP